MRTPSVRSMRCAIALLAVALVSPLSVTVAAQDEAIEGVDGDTYTSPTFGYSLSWDDGVWSVEDEFSESGYDLLELQSDGAGLYIEGVYFYQGDPEECLAGERVGIAEESGFDDLEPLVDDQDQVIEEFGDGWAYGLYGLPFEGDDGGELSSAVYLECRTLVPGSVVMIITGFLDPNDIGAQQDAAWEVIDSIEMDDVEAPEFDEADLEQVIQLAGRDINGYWQEVFSDSGEEYDNPTFITFTGPTETECGDAVPGESGPFYCPSDQTVYLDIDEMTNETLPFGVVVVQVLLAHEIAHHVQELLGLTGCVENVCGESESSLAIELQADCLAGAWTVDAASREIIQENELKRVELAVKTYLGDPPGTSQDDPDAHGTGDERFEMYMAGYEDGLEACGF